MESLTSWVNDEDSHICYNGHTSECDTPDCDEQIAIAYDNGDDGNGGVCINSVLPDDILERILGNLPISAILKALCVCKKWNDVVHSDRFLHYYSGVAPRKPWYFMFTSEFYPIGHVYDPIHLKWHRFQIPFVETPTWSLVSSRGLLCLMDDRRRKIYVCNPITKCYRRLEEPPGAALADYCALAISQDTSSQSYMVAIVRSKQARGEDIDWDLSIDIYSSEKGTWRCPVNATFQVWRTGTDCVICDGILYFTVFLTRTLGFIRPRYGVLAYDLSCQFFVTDVDECVIEAPCYITCMRLMNLEEEVVMVGGIEKVGRPGIIKGIGIWVLKDKNWEEVSRMPNKFFKGFGEFDDVFGSCGHEKLIYIQSYGSSALLMFDMYSNEWSWSCKCPAAKKSPLQLYSGICFEPRLDIAP
ncbi:F-box/kelch-repeat protein At3g61590-like [Silene latifolia]|uniref:F-box/kelch-repeat protein At3g61590-like n=1 Tax=Silene latifolia TaxID=37657 RepID=UPI003D788B94